MILNHLFTFLRFFFLRRLGVIPTLSGSTLIRALSASSNVNGCNETGLAFGMVLPRIMVTERSSLGILAENALPAASSASCDYFLEDIGIVSVVVTERKFREIEREIFFAHMVEAPHDATLEQAPETINAPRMDQPAHILALTVLHRFVFVVSIKQTITGMLISGDKRNLLVYRLANEAIKRAGVGAFDHLTNNIALARDRANDGYFTSGSASDIAALERVLVLLFSADIGFINLDHAKKLYNVLILHRSADSVAHIPSRPVVTASDLAMNLKGADSLLALRHKVNDLEPSQKRIVGILEHGPTDNGEAIAVFTTTIFVLANPVEGTRFQFIYLLAVIATRTVNAIGPAQFFKIRLASLFGRELGFDLRQCDVGLRAKDFCFHGAEYNN
jgi:hypothetical protein